MRVLVVDDSTFQRNQIKRILSELGHDPNLIGEPEEALKLLDTTKFDCIITDLLMPGMTGLQLTQEVRKRKILTPIIVLSADVQERTRQDCLSNGANFFINKPASNEKLANALNEVTKGV